MNKHIKNIIMAWGTGLCLLTGAASCEYLDVVPVETPDRDDMLTDPASALRYLYGCYGPIQNEKTQKQRYSNYHFGSDEFVECVSVYDDFRRFQGDQITGHNAAQYGVWNDYINGIGYCNQFLSDIATYEVPNLDINEKTQYIAEAKFLKAYYHYMLLNYCGPIPIMDSQLPMDMDKGDLPGRSHFDAVVKYIVGLCKEAYNNLPITYGDERYYGRATKAVCRMLEAKVRLLAASPLWNGSFPWPGWENPSYETPGYGRALVSNSYDVQKWKDAYDACEAAIVEAKAAGHELMRLADSEAIRVNDNIPLPTIPGIDNSSPEGEEFAKQVMLMRYVVTARPNQGNREFIWASLDLNNYWATSPASIPHFVMKDEKGVPGGGWGMISPTLYTVEHFYTKNGRLPIDDMEFPREDEWFTSAGLENPDIIKLCVGREPRFYANISFDGDEYSPVIAGGNPLVVKARDSQECGYNLELFGQNNQSQTGFWNKKNVHPNLRYSNPGMTNNIGGIENRPNSIFRLADLYLMTAECCAYLGGTYVEEGLKWLNEVRDRAGVAKLQAKDVTADGSMLKAVLSERFVELYFEGMRLEDIRRNVQGAQRMSGNCYRGLNSMVKDPSFEEFNTPCQIKQSLKWSNRMYLQPIPDDEVYANPQLIQAPGY